MLVQRHPRDKAWSQDFNQGLFDVNVVSILFLISSLFSPSTGFLPLPFSELSLILKENPPFKLTSISDGHPISVFL